MAGNSVDTSSERAEVDVFVANLLPADAISDWVQAEVYITDLGSPERFNGAPHEQVRPLRAVGLDIGWMDSR